MLQFYNTLTGKKEAFRPLDPASKKVGLYACGPTVYNFAHIGNLRAYVFADTLRRTLEYSGYKVKQIMNITDVGQLTSDADEGEDKMVKALRREGIPLTLEAMKEVAGKYEAAFRSDLRKLNINTSETQFPRASEHIAEDIELIQILADKRYAYKTSDGIYFDTAGFPEYGTRGGFRLGELKEGARVPVNSEKKNPRDFALWKFVKEEIGWSSPWGKGFPGWHVECSAMSRKYLGQPFDIHTGGIDHIPVHHQNEIAQSEAAYGVPLANYWMHSEFVTVAGGEKMAKSEENFLTLTKLFFDEGIMPLAYKLWLLTAHYRQRLDFSVKAILASQSFYKKVLTQLNWETASEQVNDHYRKEFALAINDDLDTPRAVALVAEVLKDESLKQADKTMTINEFDKVLGLNFQGMARKLKVIPESVQKLSAAREDARRLKDFATAAALRADIQSAGFDIMDTDSGPIIRKCIK